MKAKAWFSTSIACLSHRSLKHVKNEWGAIYSKLLQVYNPKGDLKFVHACL
jgi:hypothetical protein